MRCLSAIVATGLLLAGASARAQAPEPEEALSEIREHVMYARYREAMEQADALLGQEGLTARERNLALEAKAIAQLAKRDQARAKQTLETLYSRDPGHRLSDDDASPVVQGAFARAREGSREPVAVAFAHEPPTLERRRAPSIEARITEGADAVDEVRLAYRDADDGSWASVVMTRSGDEVRARVPLASTDDAYTLQYYLEARAPSGAALAQEGSHSDPRTIDVPEESKLTDTGNGTGTGAPPSDDTGIVGEWWLWTIVGVLVVGGAATAGVLGSMLFKSMMGYVVAFGAAFVLYMLISRVFERWVKNTHVSEAHGGLCSIPMVAALSGVLLYRLLAGPVLPDASAIDWRSWAICAVIALATGVVTLRFNVWFVLQWLSTA
ncbi:MAG: hypothetical protein ACOCUS_03515, partial [Polyangiales bacterium]